MATHPKTKKPERRRGAPRGVQNEKELEAVVRGLVELRRRGELASEMSSMIGWFSEKCGWSKATIRRRLDEIDPPNRMSREAFEGMIAGLMPMEELQEWNRKSKEEKELIRKRKEEKLIPKKKEL